MARRWPIIIVMRMELLKRGHVYCCRCRRTEEEEEDPTIEATGGGRFNGIRRVGSCTITTSTMMVAVATNRNINTHIDTNTTSKRRITDENIYRGTCFCCCCWTIYHFTFVRVHLNDTYQYRLPV
jgi:hypothetical protein